MFFIVTSNSRKGLIHFVDLEESPDWRARFLCTCEAFKYGERPCRHISACFHAIAHWAGVKEAIREEWADRLMFLLNMGHSFRQALESPSLSDLKQSQPKPEEKPAPQRTVRKYVLPPRSYETARTDPKRRERRLPARVRRDPA
jgi:hypothetical protein